MPVVGEIFEGQSSVANNGYLTIQPASGEEAVIVEIFANGGGKLKVNNYDGTTEVTKLDLSSAGGDPWPVHGDCLPVTNSKYIRVQNLNGAAMIMGWKGFYTKVST